MYIMQTLEYEEDYHDTYYINQLEAKQLSLDDWSYVTTPTIANCWHPLGVLLSFNGSTYPASASHTGLSIPDILPAGVLQAVHNLKNTSLYLSKNAVLSHNIPNTEDLLLVEGKKISEEEWIDEDIVEQTCIDAIDGEGSIVDVVTI